MTLALSVFVLTIGALVALDRNRLDSARRRRRGAVLIAGGLALLIGGLVCNGGDA